MPDIYINMRLGDNNASDLPENDTSTDDYCAWIEFTDNIQLLTEGTVKILGNVKILGKVKIM